MTEIRFDRELDGSYLIAHEDSPGDVYTVRMLEESLPPHILRLSVRPCAEGVDYAFEIGGLRSLETMLQLREMSAEEIRSLFTAVYRTANDLEEYLLDTSRLWLEPGLIFCGKNGWQFAVHPGRSEELYGQLQVLSRYVLKKADHEDEETTRMAYELFRVCHEENYCFNQIFEVLDVSAGTDGEAEEEEEETRTAPRQGWVRRLFGAFGRS